MKQKPIGKLKKSKQTTTRRKSSNGDRPKNKGSKEQKPKGQLTSTKAPKTKPVTPEWPGQPAGAARACQRTNSSTWATVQ